HNMGFLALDLLADKYGIKVDRLKFKALTGEGRIEGKKVLLVKPQTYMNLSGESVREVMNFYKEPVENLIVIYDDIDIPEGTLRIRPKGSAGTHNGMRNIVYLLGDDNFPRIRVGIGGERKMDLVNYVTGRVTEDEADSLWSALNKAAEAAADIVINDVIHAMQEYNIKPKRLKKEKEAEEAKEKDSEPATEE
ncbi:MAG: aminoacyl-tRNA hydrolase, partial [Firmicutes bacterium]|nr:aminoacyl-tRNA hydrolase [Bacillota bacterium]